MFWHYVGGAPGHARVGVTPSIARGVAIKRQNVEPTPVESDIMSEEATQQAPQERAEDEEFEWYTWTDVESDDDADNEVRDNDDRVD